MLITQRSMDQNQWVVLIVKLITNGKEVAIKWRRVRKVNSLNAEMIKEEEFTTHSKIHFLPTSVKIPSGLNWYHQQLLEKCSCKDHHFIYSVTRKHGLHSSSQEHPSNLSRIFTPPGTSGGPTTSLRTVHSPDKSGSNMWKLILSAPQFQSKEISSDHLKKCAQKASLQYFNGLFTLLFS